LPGAIVFQIETVGKPPENEDAMAAEGAMDRMQRELVRAVEDLRTDIDRVELLTAALNAFNRPIPEYEPSFHHMARSDLGAYEMSGTSGD
jgi:hypothetical protein